MVSHGRTAQVIPAPVVFYNFRGLLREFEKKRIKNMFSKLVMPVVLTALIFASGSTALAALTAVSGKPNPAANEVASGGNPEQIAISLANGFPIWYRDLSDRKLELCLDPVTEIAPGIPFEPCILELPFIGSPPSFPNNFGPEAFYWSAVALGTFSSSNGINNSALLVLAQEAAFADGGSIADGSQVVFSRIRLRIDVPIAGTYRVTHPFGSREYVVTAPGVRAINQTQDRGAAVARDFLSSMLDGPASPAPPAPEIPSINAGIVNDDGVTIGPFLAPSLPHGGIINPIDPATFAGGPLIANGANYIGLPFAPNLANPLLPLDVFQPITSGRDGVNYFEITLVNPPDGFFLDAAGVDGSPPDNTVRFSNFQLSGKIFDDGPNVAPAAVGDAAGTSPGSAVTIEVLANDTDPVGAGNVHGINPQALALVHPVTAALVLNQGTDGEEGVPTAAGGRVRRVTSTQTGKTFFRYTPPAAFTGLDTFAYVVQDRGGAVSSPATVTVTVEELNIDAAAFRPRFGKWIIAGTTTDHTDNTVTLTAGPLAALSGASEVPPVTTAARAEAGLRVSAAGIDFSLKVDPLPVSPVTQAHIHVGAPGQTGPIIFSLFDSSGDGAFTGLQSGTLRQNNLLLRPELSINGFADAIGVILSGQAYIDVHTSGNTGGELRGQLLCPLVGTAPVRSADGAWRFEGKATTSPGLLPTINATSLNGVLAPGKPLRRR